MWDSEFFLKSGHSWFRLLLAPKRSERYDKDEVAPRPSVYRRKSIFVRNVSWTMAAKLSCVELISMELFFRLKNENVVRCNLIRWVSLKSIYIFSIVCDWTHFLCVAYTLNASNSSKMKCIGRFCFVFSSRTHTQTHETCWGKHSPDSPLYDE